MVRHLTILYLAALSLVGACFVDFTESIPCDTNAQCQTGSRCEAGRCVTGEANGVDASLADGGDAASTDVSDPIDLPEGGDLGGDLPDEAGAPPCPEGMAHVFDNPIGRFCIDKYEASRPDSTDVSAGINSSEATSRAGVLPWTDVPLSTAIAACAGAGKALCTLQQWRGGCGGAAGQVYPYDASEYTQGLCNNSGQVRLTGAMPDCLFEAYGTFDMSGNVAELVDTGDQTTLAAMGGGYTDAEDVLMTCTAEPRSLTPRASVGFRCCAAAH